MKKNILIAFGLIFALFVSGTGISVFKLISITKDLRTLINLHEIEDIRQQLNFSIQKIQTYTFSSTTDFAKYVDEIIENASVVDRTVERCHECHHEPLIQAELDDTEKLIGDYEEKLSRLITFVGPAEGLRRQSLQEDVAALSNIILDKVQNMISRASATITLRTSHAMQQIHNSYISLSVTLLITFASAFYIANLLFRRIVKPIDELLAATNKIARGELGYTTKYIEKSEFGILFTTFNDMSLSLAKKERSIRHNLERLNALNKITLPLHLIQEVSELLAYLASCIAELIDVSEIGIMTLPEKDEDFILNVCQVNMVAPELKSFRISKDEAVDFFFSQKGCSVQCEGDGELTWPFSVNLAPIKLENFSIHWLAHNNHLSGAFFCINKADGSFKEDDQNIIGILANNISVAVDNIALYEDLEIKMDELQKTQRQLIETEKLTALGTLAGGIAHDFNNILCGMTGYISLLKKHHEVGTRDYKMLEILDKASFRAAALVKQLLTFSRQEIFQLKPISLNQSVQNVIGLLENTFNKLINLKLTLEDDLPLVEADSTQLEQVVMNLCVNARDAMPNGGDIVVRTEKVHLDDRFCADFVDAEPGDYLKLTVQDQGSGIDDDVLPRIFEPFFTTKEFGKGTGLGLSIVYGIIKSHGGFCSIDSVLEKGTVVSVFLPVNTEKTSLHKISLDDDLLVPYKGGDTILIVDDEEMIVSMISGHLCELGCTVLSAGNGEEALEIFVDRKDEIDLVILDINMPVMGGEEAFLKMKEIKPDVKVLISTGHALREHTSKIAGHGVEGFIFKPFNIDAMGRKIKEILASN